jgi:hypothetical protein
MKFFNLLAITRQCLEALLAMIPASTSKKQGGNSCSIDKTGEYLRSLRCPENGDFQS